MAQHARVQIGAVKAALLGRLAQEVSSGCGKNVEEDGLAKTGRMAK